MPTKVLIDLHYLPCIAYFAVLIQADEVVFEGHEHFQKQSYRNRAHILGPSKVQNLLIPIDHSGKRSAIKELKTGGSDWSRVHWRSIMAAYGKAPYFEFFADEFCAIWDRKYQYLFEANLEFLTLCLKILQVNVSYSVSEKFEKEPQKGVLDLRSAIHPKKKLTICEFPVYPQLFGNNFVDNLSIIDLLMCEGPSASIKFPELNLKETELL